MAEALAKHQFQAARAKIHRAKRLIAELEAEAAAFIATNPVKCSTSVGTDGGTAGTRIQFQMRFDGVPESISAIVGDVIHNLRSALDMTACEMVRAAGKSDKSVYFPFCDIPEDFDRMVKEKNFHRAGAKAVALLRTFQPYRGGNTALRALHDLDVHDKHKALIPGVASFAGPVIRTWDDDGTFNPTVVSDPNAVSDFRLVFPPDSALNGQELIPTFHRLVELTERVVEEFSALANGETTAGGN